MIKRVLIASAILLAFAGCGEEKKVVKKVIPPMPVEVITVKNANIPVWVQYTGKTQATSAQEVRARVAGILEKVYFTDGEYVKKGQKLFKIEQTKYKAKLSAAKAQKRQHQASLKFAMDDVARYAPLVKDGLAARITLEKYQAQVEALKAKVVSDEASIEEAALNYSYTIIKAPIDGQASRHLVDVGNLVGRSEATLLTTINQTNPMYAYFAPSEEDMQIITHYRESDVMPAYIDIGYKSKMLTNKNIFGKVNFSDNTVNPNTSTVSMRAEIPNADHKILAQTFVHVNVFVTDKIKAIGIPPSIIKEDQLGEYIYIMDKDQAAQIIYIEPIFESRYYILVKEDTLKDGDKIIVTGLMHLKKGKKLSPTDVSQTKGMQAVIKKNNLIPALPENKE